MESGTQDTTAARAAVLSGDSPTPPPELMLAHLEYAAWAARKTFAMVDRLPPEAVTQRVESSFPSILETLRHNYQWDQYYLVHLRGGSVGVEEITPPATYAELKAEWPRLQAELHTWAAEHLAERKDVLLRGWAVWPTWMIVMQIANHATHHLGQVLTLVRQAGYTPTQDDWTDLILYYLRRFPPQA